MMRLRLLPALSIGLALLGRPAVAQRREPVRERPEILRTEHGVPHIYAADFWGAGYGLAWAELEDYGARVVYNLVEGRGERGLVFGRDSLESDFARRPAHAIALARWPELDQPTRDMYDGFAAAVNDFVRSNPSEVVATVRPVFRGADVLAAEIPTPNVRAAKRLLERQARNAGTGTRNRDEGSNAWAFAPARTRSGHAILLRNPHLAWDAGYYEAQVVIPGRLDFYGDFRIGGAFAVVGGFNRDLGWATTNNNVDTDELYAMPLARGRTDRIVLDGKPIPLVRRVLTVPFRTDSGRAVETREVWTSPFGPVVDRRGGYAYILKTAGDGEFRGGQQFLRMMRATSFAEWEAAMRMRARLTSNLTYADRAGNIFYVWNGALPSLPVPSGGDTAAVFVTRRAEVWDHLVPWDSLPKVMNPPGGYLHNENDSPHFTSLERPLDPATLPANVERPSLGLRGQLALDLIRFPEDTVSLEDVIRLKHSYRMLLAERILPALLGLADTLDPKAAEAIGVLKHWDLTAAPNSRGGVLFEMWWRLYQARAKEPFATPWSFDRPIATPAGIADPAAAAAALHAATDSVRRRFGRLDVAWGEVHRVRFGSQDLPVGGCRGDLGCFRVLWFRDEPDGRRAAQGGDGWVLAVEFGEQPRAYSVLVYGESNRPTSPRFADQAARFTTGDFKRVAFLRADVERQIVTRYRAGCRRTACASSPKEDR